MIPANHKATRDGVKTQTRRLDNLKEINQNPDEWECVEKGKFTFIFHHKEERQVIRVHPRYQVGETVYIKEAYEFYRRLGTQANIKYIQDSFVTWVSIPKDKPTPKVGYHSPLFLPEWAARDFIRIKDVRPERLQSITPKDCEAEGAPFKHPHYYDVDSGMHMPKKNENNWLRIAFMELWDSINGKPIRSKEYTLTYTWDSPDGREHKHYTKLPNPYRFDANPWAWTIEYEYLRGNQVEKRTA